MIVVETDVLIDHLRDPIQALADGLRWQRMPMHPYVVGELALGSFRARAATRSRLDLLPRSPIARPVAVQAPIERRDLYGSDIGYVDAHLLVDGKLAVAAAFD